MSKYSRTFSTIDGTYSHIFVDIFGGNIDTWIFYFESVIDRYLFSMALSQIYESI